jgi:hypothetical protein
VKPIAQPEGSDSESSVSETDADAAPPSRSLSDGQSAPDQSSTVETRTPTTSRQPSAAISFRSTPAPTAELRYRLCG